MNQPSERLNSAAIPNQRQDSTFDQIKTTVAEKLHTAAETLHEKTSRGDPESQNSLSSYGREAADWLDRSADYIEEIDPQRVRTDIENQVRRHPGRSLLLAGAAGLLLGVWLRRR